MTIMEELAALVNPTSCLPRIKDEPASDDIFQALAHLALLYSPQSLNRDEIALHDSRRQSNNEHDETAHQDVIDSAKVDDNEKRYAMNWLTRLIGSGLYWVDDESDVTSADALLDLAGRILGGHASIEEAGAISREFRFPLKEPVLIPEADALVHPAVTSSEFIEIVLRDDPLPPSDTQSEANTQNGTGSSQDAAAAVGVQTWGASIVVSDVLIRHPTLFHPGLACTTGPRLRIAELGAGTGLLGMAAAKLLQQQGIPADVVLTDYHTQVLRNLEHNVSENFPAPLAGLQVADPVSVTVEHLDWLEVHQKVLQGDPEEANQSKYDLLLLADVIYDPGHALWIRSSIETFLRKPPCNEPVENAPRAHIIMAVRGSGKFEGLFKTVEEAFKPRLRTAAVPSLSASSTATPFDTMPGTPALVLDPPSADLHKGDAKHSDLLRSRMDAISLRDACQPVQPPAELTILKRRRLDKRASVGRNDEQEYLWFEIGWSHL
ncbi:related to putative S-adenosylmethionine-dependent methyltransferase of the seven beta-strand family [Ustilago trichophora]|uniref:Related to putative S-adenosylmethionine-dependent methyltransferase of the seven beta-strand family n=1 Tax=Ustilago trichophora TaxID=86804 RepID=A0A5C3DXZ2_9BASI|nr:related to putative S-adenosylmethionine-dependent methyltransferase of the seven beta-strand family [Ustilago trichophora]